MTLGGLWVFGRVLASLPFPLSSSRALPRPTSLPLATSTPRPWSQALLGPLETSWGGGRGWERDLRARKLLRHSCCRGSICFRAQRCCRSFLEVFRVVDIFDVPPIRGYRNSSQVQGLGPHLLVVFLADTSEFLRQVGFNLLDTKVVGPLLRSLCSCLGHPSHLLGHLQFCLQI